MNFGGAKKSTAATVSSSVTVKRECKGASPLLMYNQPPDGKIEFDEFATLALERFSGIYPIQPLLIQTKFIKNWKSFTTGRKRWYKTHQRRQWLHEQTWYWTKKDWFFKNDSFKRKKNSIKVKDEPRLIIFFEKKIASRWSWRFRSKQRYNFAFYTSFGILHQVILLI